MNDAGVATDGAATDDDPAADVVREITAAGGEAVAHRGDIADSAVGDALVERALDTWGRLDIVINNAGFGRPRMVFNLSDDEWDDVIRVHLRGTFVVSRPACRHWRAQAKETRQHLRAPDQHRDRTAPLRRCRAVELRRGQSGRAGVHRGGRDRDGAVRRHREHDHARREHAARADRVAHGAQRSPSGPTRTGSIRATRARRRVRRVPRVTRRGLDLGPDVPGAGRDRRAHRHLVGARHSRAGRRPGLHRRRLPPRDAAVVRRGRETRGSAAAGLEGEASPSS